MRFLRSRLARSGAAFAVVFLAAVGAALAVPGGLAPKGCIGDRASNPESCTKTARGLRAPLAVAVSNDGRSVYAVTGSANSIVTFKRDRMTGALTPAGCVADPTSNPDNCRKTAAGLQYADGVTVSPDGRSVYVAGYDGNALVRFNRDTKTGALKPAGCVGAAGDNTSHCAKTAKGLDYAESVVVSADGKHVYESGLGPAVVTFSRSKTGALKPQGCIGARDDNSAKCPQTARGLNGDVTVALSRDGKSLYATGSSDNAVVSFHRSAKTGALKPIGCIADVATNPGGCGQTTAELGYPYGIAASPDGRSVYVTTVNSGSVVVFHRNARTGALTAKGCISQAGCAQSAPGLHHGDAISVSPDGKSVYSASSGDNAIAVFARKKSGALAPMGCIAESSANPASCPQTTAGLEGPQGLVVSPDGKSVYAAGSHSDALVRFKRTPP